MPGSEERARLIRLTHALEQATAHMLENGAALMIYYDHLIERGAPPELAIRLVLRMELRLNGALPDPDEPDDSDDPEC